MIGKLLVSGLMLAALVAVGSALAQAPVSTPDAAPAAPAAAATPAPAERIAAVVTSLKRDQGALKQYEWIETTSMSLKGEEKSRKQNRCYYGADGVLEKVPVGDQPEEKSKRGLRGKAIASKKEEISDYLTKATAAIKTYLPPDPAKLQASKDAGKASIEVLEPGKRARLDFKDYNMPGDLLGIEIDLATNKLQAVQVTTMIEGGKQPVNFRTQMGSLEDGTGYPIKTTLDAKEMDVVVVIENAGYKKPAAK